MLTIQPKITQYAQQRNNVSFKGSEAIGIPDDSFYRDKQDYYENQIREFDIITPPRALQNEFAAFIEQLDKSKVTIRKSIEKLETTYRALLQEYFG